MYYNVSTLQIAKTTGLKKFLDERTDKELNLFKHAILEEMRRIKEERADLSSRSRSTDNLDVYIINLAEMKSKISEIQATRTVLKFVGNER